LGLRNSGYERQPADTYETPAWVWDLLYDAEPWARTAWDRAPVGADFDFLASDPRDIDIATNPPFKRPHLSV
jgi:hypothetical protein